MADDKQRPIIVRRKKRVSGGHHGGAWKIAYADFVTAMMAFFLLMWLLGSTAKGDLNGISDYFKTPLKVAMQGGSGSGDSSHIIKGGGADLTRSNGQLRKGDQTVNRQKIDIRAAQAEAARIEQIKFQELKHRIETALERNAVLAKYRNQLLLDITSEGLRVQIVDEKNRPMFALGRAELHPYAREILVEIGKTLNDVENKVSVTGHTDATAYASGEKGYSNWELSADRANASRRILIAGGMQEKRVVRVIGMASAVPLVKEDPHNAMNRRISLIVMNRETMEKLEKGHGPVDLSGPEQVKPGLAPGLTSGEDVKPALAKSTG
jgi:chemotaxis protein MotB